MKGVRLVFCETERKMASLNRGWRTPDPSPTRDAVDLPGCGLHLCFEEYPCGDWTSTNASTPQSHTPRRSANTPREQHVSVGAPGRFSRTPSPLPMAHPAVESSQAAQSHEEFARSVSETTQAWSTPVATAKGKELPFDEVSVGSSTRAETPRRSPSPLGGKQFDVGGAPGQFPRTPSPSPMARYPSEISTADSAIIATTKDQKYAVDDFPNTGLLTQRAHTPRRRTTPPDWQPRSSGGPPGQFAGTPQMPSARYTSDIPRSSPSPSAGAHCPSGLPQTDFSFSANVQMFAASNTTCSGFDKDASLCQPCFMVMPQMLTGVPQQATPPWPSSPAQSAIVGSSSQIPPSVGSIGHPWTCADACKFATKKVCKDGAACDHCHLCEWQRGAARGNRTKARR